MPAFGQLQAPAMLVVDRYARWRREIWWRDEGGDTQAAEQFRR